MSHPHKAPGDSLDCSQSEAELEESVTNQRRVSLPGRVTVLPRPLAQFAPLPLPPGPHLPLLSDQGAVIISTRDVHNLQMKDKCSLCTVNPILTRFFYVQITVRIKKSRNTCRKPVCVLWPRQINKPKSFCHSFISYCWGKVCYVWLCHLLTEGESGG